MSNPFQSGVFTRGLFTLLFFLTLFQAFPEEQEFTEPPAADLVITATRTEETSLTVPQFVTVVTEDEIRASGKESLPEVVAAEAGVTLYDYGYPGSLEQLWLRGATGTRVLVLIDGIPTNNSLDGQMSLSLIPKEIIERIEIVQGGMSILYGSHAVGGVINVITKKNQTAGSFLRFQVINTSYLPQSYDDGGGTQPADPLSLFDGEKIALSFGHDFGPVAFFSSGSIEWARNAYYYSDSGTVSQRVNADLIGGSAFSGLTIPWETGRATISGIYSRNAAGSPGSLDYPSPNAEQTDDRLQLMAGLHESRFFSDALSLDAKLSLTYQERTYDDPGVYSDNSKLTGVFGELSQELFLSDFFSLVYGGTVSVDFVKSTALGERSRAAGAVFLSGPFVVADIFHVYPTVRLDLYSDIGRELSFGTGMALLLSEHSSLKLSFAKSFRAPTLSELYYPYMSNPLLLPERGWHADLGFSYQTESLKIENALFFRAMSEEIKYYPPLYIPENIDQSVYAGIETRLELEIVTHFFAEASYTFLYSFDLSGGKTLADDKRVPLIPMHELHCYLSYRTDETVIRIGVDFASDRFTNPTLTESLPPHIILNANVRRKLYSFLTLMLAIDNLLNRAYQLVDGYPMPGLTMRFGVELEF